MSVEAMAIVLHHSRAKGTAKLVLLGIANHAGDGGAWPTVATLARYANVAPRNVQMALSTLVGTGEVKVTVQGGGTADLDDYSRPNRYDVMVTCPPWCDRTMHHRDTRRLAGGQVTLPVDKPGDGIVTPRRNRQGGVTESSPGGVTESSPKPSIEPSANDVPASTTDRARQSERPPAPANPPADELAKVRDRLRQATEQHHRREHS